MSSARFRGPCSSCNPPAMTRRTTESSGRAARTTTANSASAQRGNAATDCSHRSLISTGRPLTRRIATAAKRLQKLTLPKCSRMGRSRKPKRQNGCKRAPAPARQPLTGRSILMAASESTCGWRMGFGCGNEPGLYTVCLTSHCTKGREK
jgi:hypothetical protein